MYVLYIFSASGIKQSILINFLVSSSIHVHTLGDDDDYDDDDEFLLANLPFYARPF